MCRVLVLYQLFDDLFAFKTLGEVEEIQFKSSHDQIDLEGWIVKPPKFDSKKKYPLILEIHGGPLAQYANFFMLEFYYLPQELLGQFPEALEEEDDAEKDTHEQ